MPLRFIYKALFLLFIFLWISCKNSVSLSENTYSIHFLDEYIFYKDSIFPNSVIGGLSGIDYDTDTNVFYSICDDSKNPRFYQIAISIENDQFSTIRFFPPQQIKNYKDPMPQASVLDPESIRKFGNKLLISSEGSIPYGYHPSIFITDTSGIFEYNFELPSYFLADSTYTNYPRYNAVFEGLAIDTENKGFWAAAELPLTNDGAEPGYQLAGAPARITHFSFTHRKADLQFVYPLDPIARDPKGKFAVNGITALLQLDATHFLILERGYVAGYGTQGNTVRLYLADITESTNTLNIPILKNKSVSTATKKLVFDFDSIRPQLTDSIIDNLEGITFGPILTTGNPSLILVSDNNFNPPEEQLNQFILLELVKQ